MIADTLIIGAGASGAIAAKYLARAGLDVVCLDQGNWVQSSKFPTAHRAWELSTETRWNLNPNRRALPEDYPCEVSSAEIHPLMFNAVGGSTIHYAAHWPRLVPSDFRVKTLDGVADDWPISYAELCPYYDKVAQVMGVSGRAGNPAYPPDIPPPLPAHPIGKAGRKAAEGMNQLNWHWWPAMLAIPSEPWGRQSACTRHAQCMWGCPEGAKGSVDVTIWPDALASGARLVTGARAREIVVGPKGLATGAIWIDRDGAEHFQKAKSVFLAANGIGTPRLLLLSSSNRFPNGLANSSGLVGQRLMMHPAVAVMGEFDEDLESWLGPYGALIMSWEFYETRKSSDFPRGAFWALEPIAGPLDLLARCASGGDVIWGHQAHDLIERLLGRGLQWTITIEDLPEHGNHVSLDPELQDSSGIPAPKIHYRVSDRTERNIGFQLARGREALEAAGAASTRELHLMPETGWHLLGTARMGDDPKTSVVDRNGTTHDVANLHIIDGSVFVTSGAANPTATIMANALRTVDHVIATANRQKVPA